MYLHTVAPGETLTSIAGLYGISPYAIAENNEWESLKQPTPGEELLILIPTRTYTVRRSDTTDSISKRFGIRKNELIRNNPALITATPYPGQLLALRYEEARGALGVINGYVYRTTSLERLRQRLPYLTYVTVSAAIFNGTAVQPLFSDKAALQVIKQADKCPILRICETDSCSPLSNKERNERIHNCIDAAKAGGYRGVTLSAFSFAKHHPQEYADYTKEFRQRLHEERMVLFSETDADGNQPPAHATDGQILWYEKDDKTTAENVDSTALFPALHNYAEKGESNKTMVGIVESAYQNNSRFFSFSETREKEKERLAEKSLSIIKQKLDALDAFGYMGIQIDVQKTRLPILLMMNALFSLSDCPLSESDSF